MIGDLSEKRKKELLLFSNLIVTVRYLPEIMKKLKETSNGKDVDEITNEIVNDTTISLSPSNIKRIKLILRSASVKGKDHKEFKALIAKRYEKENKPNRKAYHFTSPVELFFATNTSLLETLYAKRINGETMVDEKERAPIFEARRQVMNDYINDIFSEREQQIARRKHG